MSDYEMGRYVAVRPALVEALAGDLAAAMVWSLIRYRQAMDEYQDGWSATYGELAQWTGLDERRLRRVTKALREAGWLQWYRRSWADATNIYQAVVGPHHSVQPRGGLRPTDPRTDHPDGQGQIVRMDADRSSFSHPDRSSASTTPVNQQEKKKKKRLHSDECRQACDLLAGLIESHGSKRPTVTDRWLTDMDRLNRIDGRTWEQITTAIHWCQDHDFWRANIMSPATLRKQYDRLRLQAQAEQTPSKKTGPSKFASAAALIDKMRGTDNDTRGITGPTDRSQLHRPDTAAGA